MGPPLFPPQSLDNLIMTVVGQWYPVNGGFAPMTWPATTAKVRFNDNSCMHVVHSIRSGRRIERLRYTVRRNWKC